MMGHGGNFKSVLLQNNKTTSILTVSSYLHGRVINSIKNISLLFRSREFDNLHGRIIGRS